ncbi:MAG: hypothetical protein DRM98_04110 [Thermoplasmata archaeon]|nr:MAG: hypothetical protein DRM98_04110 [Thermoplasmata archaeon]
MKTIMIIDDEKSILEDIEKTLEQDDFKVVTVDNRRKAIELIEGDDENKFSLILIDTTIPDSKQPAFFSMKPGSKKDIDTIKEEDFLRKPFTKEQLVDFIKKKIE